MKSLFTLITFLTALTLAAPVSADPVAGPKHDAGVLEPGEVMTYRLNLNGGESTIFSIAGDGDGDIDCALYDEGVHEIARDVRAADACLVSVTPRWTGVFVLVVVNVGRVASIYRARVY